MISPRFTSCMAMLCAVTTGCGAGDQERTGGPWQLVEEWRLRGAETKLRRVVWVDPTRKGMIQVVLATDTPAVHRYSHDGTLRGSIAGRGPGAGAFHEIQSVGRVGASTWVFDGRNKRITVLSPFGRVQRVHAIRHGRPRPADSSTIGLAYSVDPPFAFYDDGSRLVEAALVPSAISDDEGFDIHRPRPLVRVTADHVIERVVAHIPADPELKTHRRWPRGPGISARIPFSMRPVVAASPNGDRLATVERAPESERRGPVVVRVFNADGDTMFIAVPPLRTVPVERRLVGARYASPGDRARVDEERRFERSAGRAERRAFKPDSRLSARG